MKRYAPKMFCFIIIFLYLSLFMGFENSVTDFVDEMDFNESVYHKTYTNLVYQDEFLDVSTYDFSYLPDDSMLFPRGGEGGQVEYLVSGAKTVTTEFYSTYGTFLFRYMNDYYLGGTTALGVLPLPIYIMGGNLYVYDTDTDTAYVSQNSMMFSKVKFTETMLSFDPEGLTKLGASLSVKADDGTIHQVLPTEYDVEVVQDTENDDISHMFRHKLTFEIDFDVTAVCVDFQDLKELDVYEYFSEPAFAFLSRVSIEGDNLVFAKEPEESDSSAEESSVEEESSKDEGSVPESSEGESESSASSESSVEESSGKEESNAQSSDEKSEVSSGNHSRPPTSSSSGAETFSSADDTWLRSRAFKGIYQKGFGAGKSVEGTKSSAKEKGNQTQFISHYTKPSEQAEESVKASDFESASISEEERAPSPETASSWQFYVFLSTSAICVITLAIGYTIFGKKP